MLYVSIFALTLAACKKEKEEPIITDGKAELTSFGFYVQDNPALDVDYVMDSPSNSIEIRIPAQVDKSALIARFTVSSDDVVMIGTTVLKSGVTAANYSLPVDLIVKDTLANVSTVYAVAVKKILTMKWDAVASFTEPNFTSGAATSMAVSPTTGEPHIFYAQTNTTTTNKGSVIKWNGTGFVPVGNKEFTAGRIYGPRIQFANNGNPYVIYADNATSPTNRPTVMNCTGSTWNVVGTAAYGESVNTAYGIDFAVYGSDNRILSAYSQNAAGTVDRRALNVAYYTGSSWTANQSVSLLPTVDGSTYAAINPKVTSFGNIAYVVVALNGAGYSVLKYENATWSLLADKETFGGSVGINTKELAIAVDNAGVLYVAAPDYTTSYIRVAKYSATNNSWSVIGGGPISRLTTSSVSGWSFKLAFDKQNNPFVLYVDRPEGTELIASIVTLDPESLNWTTPLILYRGIANEPVSLEATSTGEIFACFLTSNTSPSTHYTYHLYKYAMEADD